MYLFVYIKSTAFKVKLTKTAFRTWKLKHEAGPTEKFAFLSWHRFVTFPGCRSVEVVCGTLSWKQVILFRLHDVMMFQRAKQDILVGYLSSAMTFYKIP